MRRIKDFKLEDWLKDTTQKVVCGYGWPVDIIGTDFAHRTDGKEYPILAVIHNNTEGYENDYTHFYDADGLYDPENKRHYITEHNLKIVVDEPELTEFEEKVKEIVDYVCAHPQIKGDNVQIKEIVKKLNFPPTFSPTGELDLLSIYSKGLEDGKSEALNTVPFWEKSPGYGKNYHVPEGKYNIVNLVIYRDGYKISIDELWEKLGKEGKDVRKSYA